jgi:hypothetical protein
LNGEATEETGDTCGWRLGSAHFADYFTEPLAVLLAVRGTAEFAVANLAKGSDFLATV